MRSAEIRQRVRDYLVTACLSGEEGQTLQNDDDLLQVLNSLQLMRMVIEMESMFGITIENSELDPENLGTIEKVAAFVQRKQS